jgi:hypothetical protein
MTLGSLLINELARRRELGMYFDFAGYRALRRVNSAIEIAQFLKKRGFSNPPITANAAMIAQWPPSATEKQSSRSLLVWLAFDPFCGIVALPVWLLSRLTRPPD